MTGSNMQVQLRCRLNLCNDQIEITFIFNCYQNHRLISYLKLHVQYDALHATGNNILRCELTVVSIWVNGDIFTEKLELFSWNDYIARGLDVASSWPKRGDQAIVRICINGYKWWHKLETGEILSIKIASEQIFLFSRIRKVCWNELTTPLQWNTHYTSL
jgi:hypothetical protein